MYLFITYSFTLIYSRCHLQILFKMLASCSNARIAFWIARVIAKHSSRQRKDSPIRHSSRNRHAYFRTASEAPKSYTKTIIFRFENNNIPKIIFENYGFFYDFLQNKTKTSISLKNFFSQFIDSLHAPLVWLFKFGTPSIIIHVCTYI